MGLESSGKFKLIINFINYDGNIKIIKTIKMSLLERFFDPAVDL